MYDLEADPYETTNIAKEKKEYVKQMNDKLQAWMKYQSEYMDQLMDKVPVK